MASQNPTFSVSGYVAALNQTLEYAYPRVNIEGEISSFKVNQGKFVFFDLKDADASVGCFMTVWQLRIPIEDGMKVIVTATPKLTPWGKFSLTIQAIRPSGEGSIKKSFEILRAKLEAEGLFAAERKRPLPRIPAHIGVISSTQAAGYADFIKILDNRWGGVRVDVAHVQVQGADAPDQIIRALKYFNEQSELPEVIVIIRGGGSADDLSAFNDEPLVREITASRIPTLVGVGHEVDVSLADLAADVRAATPSNAAQILVPDRQENIRAVRTQVRSLLPRLETILTRQHDLLQNILQDALAKTEKRIDDQSDKIQSLRRILAELDPNRVLMRGYALLRGEHRVGSILRVETQKYILETEVKDVKDK